MKKLFFLMLTTIILILSFSLCGCSNEIKVEENNIYNFMKYQSEEVFDIKKIDLSNQFNDKCVSYKFTYNSDNYQVKAYISFPLSLVESQSTGKCILYNRGGNSKIGLLSDEDTAKLCVSANRIIIASQYRGTDGGTGKDEFGGKDINDVLKLIDLCEKQFSFINMEDFCVLGVSRGGMMSYMTAKQDDRVKRIIAISAVSDLFASYEERDDMKKVLRNYIGSTPEENPYEYEKRSAIYWANEISVPVLIIHSKNDEQVSFSQAEAFNSELKKYNDEVSFVVREDNIHGLSYSDSQTILDWINEETN